MYGCLFHTPYWGPGLQPRHVPQLGIKPVTLWFAGLELNPLSCSSQGQLGHFSQACRLVTRL